MEVLFGKMNWLWNLNGHRPVHLLLHLHQLQRHVAAEAIHPDLPDEDLKWFKALNALEQFNANTYEMKWPGKAFSLTQSAVDHATKSTSRYLQTFIRNFGLLWTWKSDPPRWLSASEALVGSGFPLHPDFLRQYGLDCNPHSDEPRRAHFLLTSFQVQRPDLGLSIKAAKEFDCSIFRLLLAGMLFSLGGSDNGWNWRDFLPFLLVCRAMLMLLVTLAS